MRGVAKRRGSRGLLKKLILNSKAKTSLARLKPPVIRWDLTMGCYGAAEDPRLSNAPIRRDFFSRPARAASGAQPSRVHPCSLSGRPPGSAARLRLRFRYAGRLRRAEPGARCGARVMTWD